MPHITIEYSANVAEHHDIDALVASVHAAAIDHGLPPVDGLRTRAFAREHYCVADGSEPDTLAFVALAVRIGPGREPEAKKSFIEALLDAGEAQIDQEAGPLAIAWSIELNEIDPEFRINRNHVREYLQAKSGDTGAGQNDKHEEARAKDDI